MGDMGYGYGSEWHLLRMLGRHRQEFQRAIEQLPEFKAVDTEVTGWLDFGYDPTHWTQDREYQRIDFLPEDHPARRDWPAKLKPSWDAVGKIQVQHQGQAQERWLLVEAKAHTAELVCDPKKAGGTAKEIIRGHLHQTRDAISPNLTCDWLGCYYQYANRLYTLDFLLQHGVPAHLLLVYFCKDQTSSHTSTCPSDAAAWQLALHAMKAALGLQNGLGRLSGHVHSLFLPVSPYGQTPPLERNAWHSPRRPHR